MTGHIGPIGVSASSLSVEGGSFQAQGSVTLTNESANATAIVGATTQDASGNVVQDFDIDLPPGKAYTLPAPPQGQQWTIVVLTRSQVGRIAIEGGIFGVALVALAAYGGERPLDRSVAEVRPLRRRLRTSLSPRLKAPSGRVMAQTSATQDDGHRGDRATST